MEQHEKHVLIAEKLHKLNLKPHPDYARIEVVRQKMFVWSDSMKLEDGRTFKIPDAASLPVPDLPDYNRNDQYLLYIARQLGDEIAEEVEAFRLRPPNYSDPEAPRSLIEEVEDKIHELGIEGQMEYIFCISKAVNRFDPFTATTACSSIRVDAMIDLINTLQL